MKKLFLPFLCLIAFMLSACGSTAATPIVTVILPTNTPSAPTATLQLTETLAPTPPPTLSIGSTRVSEKDGATLVYVPAGEFTMGSEKEGNEKPIHTVYLDAFWIDQTEVTQRQYDICVSEQKCNPPSIQNEDNTDHPNYPAIYVSWDDANTYCLWAGRRLPTEAEWEKAARGTDGRIYPWGNQLPHTMGGLLNYNYREGGPTEVKKYPAGISPYGAYDMAGNVWEWVNDWYSDTYYQSSPASNPLGPELGELRLVRGGSWGLIAGSVRSAFRLRYPQTYSVNDFGFRCAQFQALVSEVAISQPSAASPLASAFTGTWLGSDPIDGSITTLVLVPTENGLTGTFKDSYSPNVQPPGYEGNGSGTVLSTTTAQMTFNLARWDGKTAQAPFALTLSNQNNTLTLGCNYGCPIVLQRE